MTLRTAFLAIHIATGSLGLVLGPLAMLAPKRRGRHTWIGSVYHWNMLVVCLSAVGLAIVAWSRIWWFVPIAAFSDANALRGYVAVRRRRPGWLPRHIGGWAAPTSPWSPRCSSSTPAPGRGGRGACRPWSARS